MATATLEQATAEYMSLAEGVGIIPERYRNRAFDKLEYGPGEGGIGAVLAAPAAAPPSSASGITIEQFLAGIAAGADATEFAKQLLSGDAAEEETKPARGRRGQAPSAE